jgi:PAB-dependent poly(A)-specific ribonuclease subunit 3
MYLFFSLVFCFVLCCFALFVGCVVFHQADGAGSPVMDLGHVVSSLNKLDAADEEKIVLSSRDGKSLMVVSYADVARCLDSAYHELCAGSVPPTALQHSQPY